MPTFPATGPITATIEVGVGEVHIAASDRSDVVVEVRPGDAAKPDDVRMAEQTRVEFVDDRLLVKGPKTRLRAFRPGMGSIEVAVALPTGSRIQADAGAASFRAAGTLGECRFKTGAGDVRLDGTGPLEVTTGIGAVTAESVAGRAEVSTASGKVRIGGVDGAVAIKNANGDCWVGRAGDAMRCNTANGEIVVDHACGDLTAKTANGDIRVGAMTRRSATLQTALGEIEVGIPVGTAARLDVNTKFGRVRNELDAATGPGGADEAVELRARTAAGDIVIRRSAAAVS